MDDNPYQTSSLVDSELVRSQADPPGVLNVLGDAIQILIANFALLSMIILTVWLPGNLFVNFMIYQGNAPDRLIVRAPMMIEGLFGPIYIGAMMFALSRIVQGKPVNYADSIGEGFACWGRLLGARLIAGLLITLGCLAFVIPGIYLAVRYALIAPAVVLENLGANESRERSVELTEGYRWPIFGTALIFYFFFVLLAIFLYVPLEFVPGADNMWTATVVDCISDLVTAVIQIAMFLYYWHSVQARGDGADAAGGSAEADEPGDAFADPAW